MRQAFINTLEGLAAKNKGIVLLTADLGFSVFEKFRQRFPDRFYNLGVAESNMIGMAAGMALSGLTPFAYSIATFATMRAFEFIRNDVCFQNTNVKIVGVGGGLGYGMAGFSHTNFEDLSILRPLPNLTILSPADPVETAILVRLAAAHPGPVYLRLGKVGEPVLHQRPPRLAIGKGWVFKTGKKIALFTTGAITANVLAAAKILTSFSLQPTVVGLSTIKPLDKKLILKLAATHSRLFSIEEHLTTGGLGSAIAEVLADTGWRTRLIRLGIKNSAYRTVGDQTWLRRRQGLSADQIARTVRAEEK